jgi:hypothetical protein
VRCLAMRPPPPPNARACSKAALPFGSPSKGPADSA